MNYWVVVFLVVLLFLLFCYRVFHKRIETFQSNVPSNFDLEQLAEDVGIKDLFNKKSKYQDIRVIKFNPNKLGYDKCLILNNEMQLCNNDERTYHEMIVHFPAYYIEKLHNVLIVGGGDLMTLREVMRYKNIQNATMLELDKKVMDVSKKYFKVDTFEHDPRVNVMIGDASKNIKKLPENFFDLVIIDSTEDSDNNSPLDAKWFFELCKTKMNSNGILVKNGYIVKDMTKKLKAQKRKIKHGLMDLFDHVTVYSADIPTYGDSNVYSFIMSSDAHGFREPIRNKEFAKLKKKFKDYDPTKQKEYVYKPYNV